MELYIRSERDQMKKIISKILIVILLISSCIGTINVAPVTVNAATKTNWPKGPSIYGQTGVLIEASTGTVYMIRNVIRRCTLQVLQRL